MNLFVKLKQFFLDRSSSVYPVEKKINYIFHNKDYLNQAFTHKSLDTSPRSNYERLEFLGDAVIDIIVSRELMREFPEGDEGLLTQRRASLVQKPFLAQIGQLLDLMDHLKIESSVDLKIEKIAEKQIANLDSSLKGETFLSNENFNKSIYNSYEAKINSGDPLAIAEVVRDLHRKSGQPEQSFSERQIFESACNRLAMELAAIEKIDVEAATEKMEDLLKAA